MKIGHSALLALPILVLRECEGLQMKHQGLNLELKASEAPREHTSGLRTVILSISSFSGGQKRLGKERLDRVMTMNTKWCWRWYRGMPTSGGSKSALQNQKEAMLREGGMQEHSNFNFS